MDSYSYLKKVDQDIRQGDITERNPLAQINSIVRNIQTRFFSERGYFAQNNYFVEENAHGLPVTSFKNQVILDLLSPESFIGGLLLKTQLQVNHQQPDQPRQLADQRCTVIEASSSYGGSPLGLFIQAMCEGLEFNYYSPGYDNYCKRGRNLMLWLVRRWARSAAVLQGQEEAFRGGFTVSFCGRGGARLDKVLYVESF